VCNDNRMPVVLDGIGFLYIGLNSMTSVKEKLLPGFNTEIVETLGIDTFSHGRAKRRVVIAVVIVMITGAIMLWFSRDDSHTVKYMTAEVIRDNLIVTVTATGTLEPINQVEVGSEISGTVKMVAVEHNDHVTQGQILAVLNTDQLQAKVNQAKAALQLAKAKVKQAEATVFETRNKLGRSRALAKSGLYSEEESDVAQASYDRAEAELLSARAQVSQAQAFLYAEQTTLAKATIRSPISGIVLKRDVELGQTVAATLQTPVLFILAEDLTQMELLVGVDEADVGQVRGGQNAAFMVDAYPSRSFPATITDVHFASQTIEGVVTYETVLRVDNSGLLLRPGMTATADITVNKVEHALLVPNAALRFTPPTLQTQASSDDGSSLRRLVPRLPRSSSQRKGAANEILHRVWTLRDGQAIAIPVTVGATDGVLTEVVVGEIEPGMGLLINTKRTVR